MPPDRKAAGEEGRWVAVAPLLLSPTSIGTPKPPVGGTEAESGAPTPNEFIGEPFMPKNRASLFNYPYVSNIDSPYIKKRMLTG